MAKVELKQPVVQSIVEDITGASSVMIVNYRGITVEQDTELRKQLREAGIIYKVCKNTMMKRAFEGTDFAQLNDVLEGPNAIAISKDDATAPSTNLSENTPTVETTESTMSGLVQDDELDGEETMPVQTATPIETEPPVTDATSPVTGMLTYESYEAMTEEQQIAFMETFESIEAFFEWYNTAKAEYETQNPGIEIDDGIIDLDKIGQNDE